MIDPHFWQDRPVFVTGATGLVGSWLVRDLLRLGADVVCLVRDGIPHSELARTGMINQVKSVTGAVQDQALVERILVEYEIETIIHLAAQTIVGVANRNPISTFETNIAGTWSVLEAARRSSRVRQIVVASSDKAYGDQPVMPYTEDAPLQGRHPYDVSKSCADLIAQSYAVTYDLPVVITRCGNFFGGGDLNWNRIIPGTIRSLLRGTRPIIRSDGSFIRDYFYVEDGAYAYLLLAQQLAQHPDLKGEAFNFSYHLRLTVLEIVEHVLQVMGKQVNLDIRNEALHEIREQVLDSTKARSILGWEPLFTLDEGLQRTIEWYRRFFTTDETHGAD